MKIIYWALVVAFMHSRKWISGYKKNSSRVDLGCFYVKNEPYGKRLKCQLKKKEASFLKKNDYIGWKNDIPKNVKCESKNAIFQSQPHFEFVVTTDEKDCEYEIKSKALKEMHKRELIHYISDIKNVDNILFLNETEKDKTLKKSVYLGIDLSSRYLHLGNLVPIRSLNIIRQYNTDVIILLGTSTTKIGDPSFQKEERKKTLSEEISENEKEIRKTIIRLLLQNEVPEDELTNLIEKSNVENNKEFIYTPKEMSSTKNMDYKNDNKNFSSSNSKGSLIILKNSLWYDHVNIIDFLKYGEYFSINKLLRKECFLTKLSKKLTLKDLNYLTLQAYDFIYLLKKYNTFIQLGGSDQWGNIQSGIELGQYVCNTQLFGITTHLLLHKNNVKYSKSLFEETKKLPIWISKERNAPFLFWNFLRNIEDQKVYSFLNMLTNVEVKRATEMKRDAGKYKVNAVTESEINDAKQKLADAATAYIYGEDVVHNINKVKNILKMNSVYKIKNIEYLKVLPYVEITKKELEEGKICIIKILKRLEIANSNKDAKNKITQKMIYLNENIVSDPKFYLNKEHFIETPSGHYSILRIGKKTLYAVLVRQ